jgi:hypothetical protein
MSVCDVRALTMGASAPFVTPQRKSANASSQSIGAKGNSGRFTPNGCRRRSALGEHLSGIPPTNRMRVNRRFTEQITGRCWSN